MINSSTVLKKPFSFREQNYQQKLLLNSLPLQVELDEALFPIYFFSNYLVIRIMPSPHYIFPNYMLL